MATFTPQSNPVQPPPEIVPTASNYKSSYDITDQYLPELKDELMRVRSRSSLSGFLDYNGMQEGFSADQFRWAEEGERHVIHESVVARAGNEFTYADHEIRPDITVQVHDATNNAWAEGRVTSTTATTFTVEPYSYADFNAVTNLGTANLTVFTTGSEFKKGSNGQQASLEMQIDIYDNKPIIMSETFKINNSDLTNIAWFNVNGNYFWYDVQFEETVLRNMDEYEMGMLTAERTVAASSLSGDYDGTEGYFSALKNRGITQTGLFGSTPDAKALIKLLDKVHGESNYYGYISRDQEHSLDEWLATLNSAYVDGTNYGIFSNKSDQLDGKNNAMSLGFKGFNWGGYNFHYQTWSVLKDPTKFGSDALADSGKVEGVLFPHGTLAVPANPIEGTPAKRVPYLTLMYKEMPGYSRKHEQFFTGSGRIATPTTDGDYLKLNLRSERALRTVGARKQVIITKS